jgi:ATP-dependent RNA helicase HelY
MVSDFPISVILGQLERDNLLPAIVFRSSRQQCDQDLQRLAAKRRLELSVQATKVLRQQVQAVIQKYNFDEGLVYDHPQFQTLIRLGVAAHHAGQLLSWRLLLEELMCQGSLRILIATGTVAAGVDFPARSVVITSHTKRGNEGFGVLTSAEFQQMSGRAGRRGKDKVGFCLIAPNPFCDARILADVAERPPEPLRSAYFAAPSTVLNLLKYRSTEELHYLVDRSLASFLDRKAALSLRDEAAKLESSGASALKQREDKFRKRIRRTLNEAESLDARQLNLLEHSLVGLRALGYIADKKLTEKGQWAANLHTSLLLFLAEAIADDFFLELNAEELVALVASISGDSHRNYLDISKNPIPAGHYRRMQSIVEHVQANYFGPQANSELKVNPDAALTVLTWIHSTDWREFSGLLKLARIADGDAARLISQTADHLNQICRLSDSHPELADAARIGRESLLRPPINEAQ